MLRTRAGQKEPPRLGSTICYGQTWARKSQQDSAVRFVTAKSCPERATKTRQYDLLRPRVGQKEPPRLGSTICYGQELARKSHRDSAVRFVTAKSWPERATETRQYDLLRPRVGQKKPPRLGSTICGPERATKLGSTICYGQTWARKSQQDSAVRFVTAKSWPEGATKTRQYDLLRPRVGQKEPPRLGSTICYGQTWARKSHQDSAVRFCYGQTWARKSHQDSAGRARKSHQDSCYGQELSRKSHQDSAVRFVTAKSWPEKATNTLQYDLLRPTARATKTRQYDLLRPRVGQKEPPRLDSTICYGQTWARKNYQDSAVRFVTAKRGPERATETRQYDLLRPNVGQKEPPRLGSTICYGQTWARKSHQDSAGRARKSHQDSCYGQELSRKSHQDSAVRFVTAKSCPERATKTRQYDLLRPRVGQKEPPRLGNTFCYGQELTRKSQRDSAVRFVTAKSWPEGATKTRQYDLLRPRVGQKEPPRLDSSICYGQELARKSHRDSAARFVTAKSWPERATKTRQYDLLRPNVGQKEPPRLGSTICYGQMWARKSHQDSAVRFVTAKSCQERATQTRQYDLLRPRVGQKSHQDSAIRFDTAKSWPEKASETRQYDLLLPRVG